MINLHRARRASKARTERRGRRWPALAVSALFIVLGTGITGYVLYYADKLPPFTVIAGVSVGGLSLPEATERLKSAFDSYRVTLVVGEETLTPSQEELGIGLDAAVSVRAAFLRGHTGLPWERPPLREPSLAYSYDEEATDRYIAGLIETTSRPAQNARLQVEGERIVIVPEVPGQATGIERAPEQIAASLASLASVRLVVGLKTLEPEIKTADLASAQGEAQALISPSVTLAYQGRIFRPGLAARAGWLAFTEDPEARTNRVLLSDAAIKRYLEEQVSRHIAYPATPRRIQVNVDEGNAETVTQEGKDGLAVDTATLVAQIKAALTARRPLTASVPTAPVVFKTETRKVYNRWIEVDLSEQRLIAWDKDQQVLNVLISSGTRFYPTVQGTFYIYAKTRIQAYRGGSRTAGTYYYLPNVEWSSWFYGDYAIHGTYWHNNFGTPMSHGCVNATNTHAKFIYEWAPVGTAVVVHA